MCIDGFLSDVPVKFPFENLTEYTSVITYKPVRPQKPTSFYNIIEQIISGLKECSKLDDCDCIREFSEDIKNINFLEEEKNIYGDLNDSPFLFGLKSIEYCRKNIADMFYNMSNEFPEKKEQLVSLQSKIYTVAEQWKLIIIYLIKSFYSNKASYYINKSADLLNKIADNEEEVAYSILHLIR